MNFIKIINYFIILSSAFANAYVNINIFGTGLYLPYSMGVIGYIKNNIPTREYNITGTSGGAWCALLYMMEDDLSNHDELWDFSIGPDINRICFHNDIRKFQSNVEKNLKLRYANRKIDLDELNKISIVSSNVVSLFNIKNEKKSKFDDINDLIDYCLCSSYIPYISGNSFSKKYKGKYYIDGEIKNANSGSISPDVHLVPDVSLSDSDLSDNINIHRFMWGRQFSKNSLMYLDKDRSRKLFKYGWEDTEKNKDSVIKLFNK
jgi:hypothetical protein